MSNLVPPAVAAAIRLGEETLQIIEDLSERTQAKYSDFFESVTEKIEAILDTLHRQNKVTEGQTTALENMNNAVRKYTDE